jgi:hypothetical protein
LTCEFAGVFEGSGATICFGPVFCGAHADHGHLLSCCAVPVKARQGFAWALVLARLMAGPIVLLRLPLADVIR